MHVSYTAERPPTKFVPFSIIIEFETEDDLAIFRHLVLPDIRIPDMLIDTGTLKPEDRYALAATMQQIARVLNAAVEATS